MRIISPQARSCLIRPGYPNRLAPCLHSVITVYRRFSAFLRFSPPPGAAPRLTAFAGLNVALGLCASETFESAVPSGAGDR